MSETNHDDGIERLLAESARSRYPTEDDTFVAEVAARIRRRRYLHRGVTMLAVLAVLTVAKQVAPLLLLGTLRVVGLPAEAVELFLLAVPVSPLILAASALGGALAVSLVLESV